MKKKYSHAGLGGTFDHFHKGHEAIIDKAFSVAEKVSIGVTTPEMTKDKSFARSLESFSSRIHSLESYLKTKGYLSRTSIFPLENIYGTTLTDSSIDSIVVSSETKPNAQKANEKRKELGFPPLDIIEIDLVTDYDEEIVRSSLIRKGMIDRVGFPYMHLFSKQQLRLPEELRSKLRTPLHAPILRKNSYETAKIAVQSIKRHNPVVTIAVGDIVTQTLGLVEFTPNISIIDYRSRRKKIAKPHDSKKYTTYSNSPGTINRTVVLKIKQAIKRVLDDRENVTIVIDGEEDLLALPAILLAPLKSIVLYGQMDLGIVLVEVTEEMKEKVAGLVKKFES